MSILVFRVGVNQFLLVESVHYSNCKECVNNNNDNDDGMILSVFKELIYEV